MDSLALTHSEDSGTMEEFIIWETDSNRIRECETAVFQALQGLGLKGKIMVNSEPPLISRHRLWDRLPVLEIRGEHWSLHPGEPFTTEQLVGLFQRILRNE